MVVALGDPDPRVDGRGIDILRAAGVAVEVGCREGEARELAAGYLKRVRTGLPWLSLKLAWSLDGRIATAGSESKWITGEAARAEGHRLRASHDAIMVGSGTALADDPLLTCRVPGLEDHQPVRVVVDRRLRLPPTSRLAATVREVPVWVLAGPEADQRRAADLAERGVEICGPTGRPGGLGGAGGARYHARAGGGWRRRRAALLRERLVDRLYLFEAPLLLGAEGLAGVGDLGVERLAEAPRWRRVAEVPLGDDRLTVLDAAG